MVRSVGIAFLAELLCLAATVEAADKIDVSAGRDLAEQWCTECHDIRPAGRASPNPFAPSFAELAALPDSTELSVRAMLRNEHLTMPQVKFTPEQMDDIVGYLLSLKPAR